MPASPVARLIAAENFPHAVRHLARRFVDTHVAAPRMSALFATQQRWLLCNLALACYYREVQSGARGATRQTLSRLVLDNEVASRNTFQAFFDEALKYNVIRPVDSAEPEDKDIFEPTPASLLSIANWYYIHFQALDIIDGGCRSATFAGDAGNMLARAQPLLADALLSNPEVRVPGTLYEIFTWVNSGGLLMDRLIAGIEDEPHIRPDAFLTNISSISDLAQAVGLSRPHVSRILSSVEMMGGLGWTARRGRSPIWISQGFYDEYGRAQARKLAIFDDLAALPSGAGDSP